MTEPLVSAEIAQALKDKGFNWKCNSYAIHPNIPTNDSDLGYSAPTLSHAAMWLREVKGLHVTVSYELQGWFYLVHDIVSFLPQFIQELGDDKGYPTHDTALSAGILNALKMI
jgi:hypothetical protein